MNELGKAQKDLEQLEALAARWAPSQASRALALSTAARVRAALYRLAGRSRDLEGRLAARPAAPPSAGAQ